MLAPLPLSRPLRPLCCLCFSPQPLTEPGAPRNGRRRPAACSPSLLLPVPPTCFPTQFVFGSRFVMMQLFAAPFAVAAKVPTKLKDRALFPEAPPPPIGRRLSNARRPIIETQTARAPVGAASRRTPHLLTQRRPYRTPPLSPRAANLIEQPDFGPTSPSRRAKQPAFFYLKGGPLPGRALAPSSFAPNHTTQNTISLQGKGPGGGISCTSCRGARQTCIHFFTLFSSHSSRPSSFFPIYA
jgi:hypothetical protein